MRKTAVMLLVGLMCGSAFSFNLGANFGFVNNATKGGTGTEVSARIGLTEKMELAPRLGFCFGDGSTFAIGADFNYYLSSIGDLQQYLGGGLDFSKTAVLIGVSKTSDSYFGINGHYGLRYDFNDVVGVFGQVGLDIPFAPDFMFGTFSSGVGLTFQIIK